MKQKLANQLLPPTDEQAEWLTKYIAKHPDAIPNPMLKLNKHNKGAPNEQCGSCRILTSVVFYGHAMNRCPKCDTFDPVIGHLASWPACNKFEKKPTN